MRRHRHSQSLPHERQHSDHDLLDISEKAEENHAGSKPCVSRPNPCVVGNPKTRVLGPGQHKDWVWKRGFCFLQSHKIRHSTTSCGCPSLLSGYVTEVAIGYGRHSMRHIRCGLMGDHTKQSQTPPGQNPSESAGPSRFPLGPGSGRSCRRIHMTCHEVFRSPSLWPSRPTSGSLHGTTTLRRPTSSPMRLAHSLRQRQRSSPA
jgi:hypothetical protein